MYSWAMLVQLLPDIQHRFASRISELAKTPLLVLVRRKSFVFGPSHGTVLYSVSCWSTGGKACAWRFLRKPPSESEQFQLSDHIVLNISRGGWIGRRWTTAQHGTTTNSTSRRIRKNWGSYSYLSSEVNLRYGPGVYGLVDAKTCMTATEEGCDLCIRIRRYRVHGDDKLTVCPTLAGVAISLNPCDTQCSKFKFPLKRKTEAIRIGPIHSNQRLQSPLINSTPIVPRVQPNADRRHTIDTAYDALVHCTLYITRRSRSHSPATAVVPFSSR